MFIFYEIESGKVDCIKSPLYKNVLNENGDYERILVEQVSPNTNIGVIFIENKIFQSIPTPHGYRIIDEKIVPNTEPPTDEFIG